jgi:hypothetical protein
MLPQFNPEKVTYFAQTDYRNKRVPFGIKAKDRSRHVYVIGKTGMGKSTLLENMALQDIQGGEGMCFIDPHGKTADLLLEYVPKERLDDVMYFAPFDTDHPISFNVMEDVGADKRHLVANGLMSAFKKIWQDAWSARMEYILNNTILALLEYPDATIMSINRMYSDKAYRKKVVEHVTDSAVRSFWVDEFANYTDRFAAEATPAIQNKVGQFISNPLIRNIIGQPKSSFDFRKMMDERKIIIINLSKGQVGEDNAKLLGSMLITKIYLAAMSRADLGEGVEALPPFYLFVDEFQSFANESFADILSEARKYKLSLTIAHQYVEQMPEEVRAAVFGNVGTMITFRIGAFDAELLEKEFSPDFTAEDLVNLGFAQIYLKLMIDGVSSQPFSAQTLPPIKRPENVDKQEIIDHSRKRYSCARADVEKAIDDWQAEGRSAEPTRGPSQTGGNRGGERPSNNARGQDRSRPQRSPERHSDAPRPQSAPQRAPMAPRSLETAKPPVPDEFKGPSKNPFKDIEVAENGAVALKDSAENKERTVPLSALSRKPRQSDPRSPTPEKRSALKDALSSILNTSKTSTQTESQQQSDSRQRNESPRQGNINTNQDTVRREHVERIEHVRKIEEVERREKKPEPKPLKEVPEDTLRKLLTIDE